MAYDVVDFQKEVIDASFQKPVLVDFWAPWCGPCRSLGPVLEKLAVEESDRWTLAKVNTDQNQEISVQYGIRGIPAVKLFVDGEVVNEFTGALPEHMVKKWLAEAIPTGETMQLDAAKAALEAGNTQMATDLLNGLLATDPSNANVRFLLAKIMAMSDLPTALALIDSLEANQSDHLQIKETIQTLGRLYKLGEDVSVLPDEDGKDNYVEAVKALTEYDWNEALQAFIKVIQSNRYYDEDGARKACIAIFNVLGPTHEYTRKNRRLFDMVLY